MAVWNQMRTFDHTMTDMMERLPTELMAEVVRYSDRSTIHSFAIVSSKYCEIAQPLLFCRIKIHQMEGERLALFVDQMEHGSILASMIKILMIRSDFTPELLRRLFRVVSNLELLFVQPEQANSVLSSHYFPNLRRLHFRAATPGVFSDVVTNFIPRHRVLDHLGVSFPPVDLISDSATLYTHPLTEAVSSGVDRLVTYRGPNSLLSLLTPNSKMKHLISTQQLDEGTLNKLSSDVSGGLLSLIIDDPMDLVKSQTLPGPLIPSLFPTLQSIAWLSLDIQSTSVIDQLPHLRRAWFTSGRDWQASVGVGAFVSQILEFSDKKTRPLQEIRVLAQDENPCSLTYSKESSDSPWVLETIFWVGCIMDSQIG